MSYIESTISENEKIIHVAEYHWTHTFAAWLWLLFLGVLVIGVIMFFKLMIEKWTTERALTNARLIKKVGWISRSTEEIRLNRIEEVNLDQSFLGRVFGYGDVTVAGVGQNSIKLNKIDDPEEFIKYLNDARYGSAPA